MLKAIREVNAIKLEENDILVGNRYHTAGSEPYSFDTSYANLNGRCVVAEEIGDRDKDTMRPQKWKCTKQCRLLTHDELVIVLGTKSLFQMSVEDLRAGLDDLDSGCSHVHHDSSEHLGHLIYCDLPECSSPLRVIRAAAPHYPVMRMFTRLLYSACKCHMTIKAIDSALQAGDIDDLIAYWA